MGGLGEEKDVLKTQGGDQFGKGPVSRSTIARRCGRRGRSPPRNRGNLFLERKRFMFVAMSVEPARARPVRARPHVCVSALSLSAHAFWLFPEAHCSVGGTERWKRVASALDAATAD
ncbi:Protein kinase domain-containing protein [Psidium guajava]|nr:Protein kinase domain-containing protein [Psidium guajava]